MYHTLFYGGLAVAMVMHSMVEVVIATVQTTPSAAC